VVGPITSLVSLLQSHSTSLSSFSPNNINNNNNNNNNNEKNLKEEYLQVIGEKSAERVDQQQKQLQHTLNVKCTFLGVLLLYHRLFCLHHRFLSFKLTVTVATSDFFCGHRKISSHRIAGSFPFC